MRKLKPECIHGHKMQGDNIGKNSRGDYYCRKCKSERDKKWRKKHNYTGGYKTKEAAAAAQRRYYAKNHVRVAERERTPERKARRAKVTKRWRDSPAYEKYLAENKEEISRYKKYHHTKNKEKYADRTRERKFGLTREQYDQMREAQDYCCKICGTEETQLSRKLCVDHDHRTGRVRGLLCGRCNAAIGLMDEKKENFEKAIVYLDEYRESKKRKVKIVRKKTPNVA